ncbi:type IV secretion system DNA-binding domain-containing protein [Nocardioides sp.]|uniref:type IV secretion system DNA-binding domain-containing protein n=1 Tax=Nocardioides sp. TaxID=35761 RepID=UPI00199C5CD0|nr:type IV secretion system DNA-binding domain-containing protein [Nocardioides sp.]MBC7279201.1 type IV secretion system DNA-binding domain-containing protein [Nocardioides sp.]
MRIWNRKKSAPSMVELDDVRDELAATRAGTVILGAGESGPMTLDLEHSHVLVVGGSGTGKRVLMRSIAAQGMAHGEDVVILDGTGRHRWAAGHPDAAYAASTAEMHFQLVRLGEELADRMVADNDELYAMRRVLLVVENRGELVEALRWFWEQNRTPADPAGSPAVAALAALEWASPLLRMHVVAAVNSPAALPAASRSAYGVRVISARVNAQSWAVASRGLPRPLDAESDRRGRFWVAVGQTAAPVQALSLSEDESRHLAAAVILSARRIWGAA